jgi:hypothetical protein
MSEAKTLQRKAQILRRASTAADYFGCLLVGVVILYLLYAVKDAPAVNPYKLVYGILLILAVPFVGGLSAIAIRLFCPVRCPNCSKVLNKYLLGFVADGKPHRSKKIIEWLCTEDKLDVESPDSVCPFCAEKFVIAIKPNDLPRDSDAREEKA